MKSVQHGIIIALFLFGLSLIGCFDFDVDNSGNEDAGSDTNSDDLCKEMECDEPPKNHCNEENDSWVVYETMGFCNQGSCSYSIETSITCENCSDNCVSCQETPCPATNGECKVNGACDTSNHDLCDWDDAPDDTSCRAEDDAFEGYCKDGACVECNLAQQCTTPPGPSVCFDRSECKNNACHYIGKEGVLCKEAICENGAIFEERYCTANATCPEGVVVSCNGFACADSLKCRTTCSEISHCAENYNCNQGTAKCEPDETVPDAATSSISVHPDPIVADGKTTSQVVIALKDINGKPISGSGVEFVARKIK